MFQKLSFQQIFVFLQLSTLPQTSALNLSLIANFFPNNIELCNINHAFKFALQKSTNLFFPVKCYNKQMIQVYEMVHNKMIIMRKELKQ